MNLIDFTPERNNNDVGDQVRHRFMVMDTVTDAVAHVFSMQQDFEPTTANPISEQAGRTVINGLQEQLTPITANPAGQQVTRTVLKSEAKMPENEPTATAPSWVNQVPTAPEVSSELTSTTTVVNHPSSETTTAAPVVVNQTSNKEEEARRSMAKAYDSMDQAEMRKRFEDLDQQPDKLELV